MASDVRASSSLQASVPPLVGRKVELTRFLAEGEATAREARPRLLTLLGEPGVGKTRLLEAFAAALPSSGLPFRLLRAGGREHDVGLTLVERLVRARFASIEGLSAQEARSHVGAEVARVLGGGMVDDVLFVLGPILGLLFEETALSRAVAEDPQQGAVLRPVLLRAFLEADASDRPLCLLIDDLHHAGPETLSWLRTLVLHGHGAILLVGAARPALLDRQEDWLELSPERHRVDRLEPLSQEEAEALFLGWLGLAPEAIRSSRDAWGPLLSTAFRHARGNPARTEHVLKLLQSAGAIELAPGAPESGGLSDGARWVPRSERLEGASLPLRAEDAVASRMASLSSEERAVLEQAALMGSVFWAGALLALQRAGDEAPELWNTQAEDAAGLARLLAGLVARDYILKLGDSTFAGSDEYIFKHTKEREALRAGISASSARRAHRVIAEWLDLQEVLHTSEEYVAMVAKHWEAAGEASAAGLAYLEAGSLARKTYATQKACDYLGRGLELLGEREVRRRIDALHDWGDVLLLKGQMDDALAAFREMLTLAYRLDLRSKGGAAHNRIGRLHRDLGELDEAGRHLEAGLQLFVATSDARGVASSTDDLGKLAWMRGEYDDALARLQEGLARRRKLGDRRSIALSLNNLGMVLLDSGDFARAIEMFEQSLAIRREVGDLVGTMGSLNNLGIVAQDQREHARALALFREALEVARRIGDHNRVALVLTNLGETCYFLGDAAQALSHLQKAEELCDELGDRLGLAEVLRSMGNAYLLQGDLQKARDCIGRAVDLFAQLRNKVHLGSALRTLGEITAAGGWGALHTRSAREYFARSVAIFEETGTELELARTFKAYARFLRTEPDVREDLAAQAEAEHMEQSSEAIFQRLKPGAVRATSHST